MIAVLFEVTPKTQAKAAYLDIAAELLPHLSKIDGFISIERFQSLSTPEKLLSLSFWQDQQAVSAWREQELHQAAQMKGKNELFSHYRIRVAAVIREHQLGQEPSPITN